MGVKDILKPKSRSEIWALTVQRHIVLMIGIPSILVGLTMAITFLSCIEGSSYINYLKIEKVNWAEATGDSTFVDHVPTPALVLDESLKNSVKDSIIEVYEAAVDDDWVALEIKKPVKEQPNLPLVFKENVTFFKRMANITTIGLLILITGLFIILPIVAMVRRYGDDDNARYY